MKIQARYKRRLVRMLLAALLTSLLVTACFPDLPAPEATVTPNLPTPTPTATPNPTATTAPVGDDQNPLRLAVVSESSDSLALDAAINLAAQLDELSGYRIQAEVYPSYQEILDGLRNQTIQITFLPPLTYMLASRRYLADAALLSNHFGVYEYGTQFLAKQNSDLTLYFDPLTNTSTAEAGEALIQFENLRPCLTEPSSLSGYILPAGLLLQNDVNFQPAVVTQTHSAVVRALYSDGICDFGATFAHTGDPRTASDLEDLPGVMEEIVTVWQSEPLIPNTNISYHPHLDEEMRQRLTDAFLEVATTEEGLQLMTDAITYEVQGLKVIDDSLYDPLRVLVRRTETNLDAAVGK